MKKTLLAISLLAGIGAFAQTTVTFDDLTLSPESYYDGSDSSGGFISGGVTFENQYNHEWGYWSGGFIYSNSTDVTTAGYTNDFSAYTGIGASGSANYSVNYGGNIDFSVEKELISITVTNTTFAALSMLNGDAFGKVFGSPNNAQGTPDGTNGEDFFRLLITGYDGDNDSIGTVIVYLADYRFADSTQDYILDEWQTVDLTPLGNVRYLDFALESSDNGDFGMNTPAYFALDNLVYDNVAGIGENKALAFSLYPNPTSGNVVLKSAAGTITVTNAAGAVVYNGTTNGWTELSSESWSTGYYVVTLWAETGTYHSTLVKN
jgi:hypothetical protein